MREVEAKVEAEPVAEAPATPEPAPATATAEASGDAGKKSADDILAMIRNRQSSQEVDHAKAF